MVHVVRANDGAHELLEHIVFLVRALGAGEAGQGVRAALGLYRAHPFGDEVEGLVP